MAVEIEVILLRDIQSAQEAAHSILQPAAGRQEAPVFGEGLQQDRVLGRGVADAAAENLLGLAVAAERRQHAGMQRLGTSRTGRIFGMFQGNIDVFERLEVIAERVVHVG